MTEDWKDISLRILSTYLRLRWDASSTLIYSVQSLFCEGNIEEDTSILRQIASPYLGMPRRAIESTVKVFADKR